MIMIIIIIIFNLVKQINLHNKHNVFSSSPSHSTKCQSVIQNKVYIFPSNKEYATYT